MAANLRLCGTGHVIHNNREIVGVCAVCTQVFCPRCETVRCRLDGNEVHRRCADVYDDGAICQNHNFARRALFGVFKA